MRVDEKITRGEYFDDSRFAAKKRVANGAYERTGTTNGLRTSLKETSNSL